jgi:hypothetical protein
MLLFIYLFVYLFIYFGLGVLVFKLRACTLSHSTSPFFVMSFSRLGFMNYLPGLPLAFYILKKENKEMELCDTWLFVFDLCQHNVI